MPSAFNVQTGEWDIAWPGRVAKHDVVYLTPPTDPMQGMPLGNGDLAALCWCEESRLIIALNKCDLWDDAAMPEKDRNWEPEAEEHSTTLRHAGRLILDFHAPVFDPLYLSDCRGAIHLAEGTIDLQIAGPFGRVAITAFVAHDENLFSCTVTADFAEALPCDVTLERFGSRTFSHWYELVNRDATIGVAGTEAMADAGEIAITHVLTGGTFAIGCAVTDAASSLLATRQSSHAATLACVATQHQHFSLLASVTSPQKDDPVPVVQQYLTSVRERGLTRVLATHRDAWKRFWLRSLMEFGDDYLDNLWHLTMYFANAAQGGPYPGRFINGLWGWNRDIQPWNYYFHWNQQELYWPLNAAGHHELVTPYLAYRSRALPLAMADARAVYHADGAFVSDVCERRGYNAELNQNHTPVAQIAMDFWRQYCFTGDRNFLRNEALPYLLQAARYFESCFVREDDGLYHAKEGTGYEGWIPLRDGTTELTYGHVLFAAVLAALREAGVEEPRAAHWEEILTHLAPMLTLTAGNAMLGPADEDPVYQCGAFRDESAPTREYLAAGYGLREQRVLSSRTAPAKPEIDIYTLLQRLERNQPIDIAALQQLNAGCNDGIFPVVEQAPVFPAGLIGLAQRGTDQFQQCVTTAKLFSPSIMGWDPLPIVLARLGLGDEAAALLAHFPTQWQFYCNGWGHYGPQVGMKMESSCRFRQNQVRDAGAEVAGAPINSQRFPFALWPFRHMGLEPNSVLACTMNEALLQSHDGVIRVAPAVTAHQQARFTLHATGGFIVSAEIVDGVPAWIHIASQHGGECHVENPWTTAYRFAGGQLTEMHDARDIVFPTAPGERWLLVPEADAFAYWECVPRQDAANETPKIHADGYAQLGLPRMF